MSPGNGLPDMDEEEEDEHGPHPGNWADSDLDTAALVLKAGLGWMEARVC